MTQPVLITGAAGFLGGALCAAFAARGTPLRAWGWNPYLRRKGDVLELDLTDARQLREALDITGPVGAVVHLAGQVDIRLEADPEAPGGRPRPGLEDAAALWRANLLATVQLAEVLLTAGAPRVVFASSQTVYGMPAENPLTEESPVRPLEHYAASKLAAEQALDLASRRGLPVSVFRFPGLYAEDRPTGVVARWCGQAAADESLVVDAAFPLPLDVIHRDDVVDGIVRRLDQDWTGFRVYNVASGEPCSLTRLADEIARLGGVPVEHREAPQPDVCMDAARARREIGWMPRPRAERLQAMIEQGRNRAG